MAVLHVEAGIAEARARMERDGAAEGDGARCPVTHSDAATSCPVAHGDEATNGGGARGLNEVTAAVVDDLGRRMTSGAGG